MKMAMSYPFDENLIIFPTVCTQLKVYWIVEKRVLCFKMISNAKWFGGIRNREVQKKGVNFLWGMRS